MRVVVNNPDGTPYDLTGCTFLGLVRVVVADAAVMATFAITLDGAATTGAFFIFLSVAQMAALMGDNYAFDVRVTPPSGEAFIVLGESRLTLRKSVTR